MNVGRCVLKNTFVLLVSQVVSVAFGFIYFIYMARYLGVKDFGILTFALSFTGILSIFSDLGISTLTVREVARNKKIAKKYYENATFVKLILAVIFLIIVYITINIAANSSRKEAVVYLIALSVVLNSLNQNNYSIFSAYEMMEYKSIGEILTSSLLLIGSLFVIYKQYDLIAFATLYPLSNFIVLVYTTLVVNRKFLRPQKKIDLIFLKSMVKEALPFGLSSIFVTVFYQIDTVMLSIMKGDVEVGIYNAAYKIVLTILIIRTILHSSTFPLMARSYIQKTNESFENICEYLFRYLFIFIVPIAIGTTILSEKIIVTLYGTDYMESALALQILIWSDVVIFFNSYPRIFEVANRQKALMKINATGMVFNIILNYLMIPHWSYIGASIATVITELLVLIIEYKISKGKIYDVKTAKFIKKIPWIILSGLIMGALTYNLMGYNLMCVIGISAIFYIFLLYITKTLDSSDYSLMKNMIRR